MEKDHKSRASHTGRRSRFFIFSGVRGKEGNLKEAPPVLQRAPQGEQGLLPRPAYSVIHSISSKKRPSGKSATLRAEVTQGQGLNETFPVFEEFFLGLPLEEGGRVECLGQILLTLKKLDE